MKGGRGHRSRRRKPGFQPLRPFGSAAHRPLLLEKNAWFLCCHGEREAKGRGDKPLGTLFGGLSRGAAAVTWLHLSTSYPLEDWLVEIHAVGE